MPRCKPLIASAVALFFAAETALGILFQTGYGNGAVLRYATVLLACLFCGLLAERSWAYYLTQLALLLTACADWFLVLPSPPNQLPGMVFFSLAQLAYGARLCLAEPSPRRRRVQLWARVLLSAAALTATVLVLGKGTDAVALVSMLYYANLILNLILAWTQLPKQAIMAVGLTLFLLCDTLIGLAFLDGYIPIGEESVIYRIIHPGFDLAWAFYLPSQMLLAVSLLPVRKRTDPPHPPRNPA